MTVAARVDWLTEELATFLASCPSPEEMLAYHPSTQIQERANDLLRKEKEGRITPEEKRELDQFEYAEMLMRLVKARLRGKKKSRP
jgi:hypothetical protein